MNNDYDALIRAAGEAWNVDPALLKTVFHIESSGNPNTKDSYQGAQGGFQIIPPTQRLLGVTDVHNMQQSAYAAAKYLRMGLDATGNDPNLALKFYHGGPDTSQWGPKTAAYAIKGATIYGSVSQSLQPGYVAPTGTRAAPTTPATTPAITAPGITLPAITASAVPSVAPSGTPLTYPTIADTDPRRGSDLKGVVIHHTGMIDTVEGVKKFMDEHGTGATFIMDRAGNVTATGDRGAHQMRNGSGAGKGLNNSNVVGLEIMARDDNDVTPEQAASAQAFVTKNWPTTPVYGHGEVNPGHKQAREGMTVVDAVRASRKNPQPPAPVDPQAVPVVPPTTGTDPAMTTPKKAADDDLAGWEDGRGIGAVPAVVAPATIKPATIKPATGASTATPTAVAPDDLKGWEDGRGIGAGNESGPTITTTTPGGGTTTKTVTTPVRSMGDVVMDTAGNVLQGGLSLGEGIYRGFARMPEDVAKGTFEAQNQWNHFPSELDTRVQAIDKKQQDYDASPSGKSTIGQIGYASGNALASYPAMAGVGSAGWAGAKAASEALGGFGGKLVSLVGKVLTGSAASATGAAVTNQPVLPAAIVGGVVPGGGELAGGAVRATGTALNALKSSSPVMSASLAGLASGIGTLVGSHFGDLSGGMAGMVIAPALEQIAARYGKSSATVVANILQSKGIGAVLPGTVMGAGSAAEQRALAAQEQAKQSAPVTSADP